MKKIIIILVVGALAALAWLIWLKPAKQEEAEAKVETVVAVHVGKVERATLRARVEVYGTVEAEPAGGGKPAGAARLSTPTTGLVLAVPVREGQRVEAGAVVVRLDDRAALAQLQLAEQQMTRQSKLKASGGASEKTFQEAVQQLAAARMQLAQVQLTTPLAGIVARIYVQPGQTVEPNTVVADVIDPDRLVITASVPTSETVALKAGQLAELMTDRDTASAQQGRVLFVSPQVDAQTDTTMVRLSVPPATGLRPGQFIHARIITEEHSGILAVPREAVYTDHDGQSTLSIVENEVAKQQVVKVGLRDGGLVEVEGAGLKAGQMVVTVGSYALPKETKIKILGEPSTNTAATPLLLELKQTIPLPDVKGGFDLMAVDLAGQRLFVNAEDNNTTEVIDLAAGQRIHTIADMQEPKWVVYRPDAHKLYIANGDGKVRVLNADTFASLGAIEFKEKSNNLRFDPQTQELFVGVGKTFGAIGIVDAKNNSITAQIPLANFPKQFELDGNLIYVNVPKANHIAVVDRTKKEVVATWPVKEAQENIPTALDRAHHRLFVGCEAGKLVVFDTATGQSVASMDISAEPDGIYYDAARQLLYVSCGAGAIDVIRQADADHYTLAERVPTAKGAATSLFIPEWRKLILAVPQRDQQTAELRVFQAGS